VVVVDRVTTTTRAEATEEFAAILRALRASAGSPSFRTMSGISRAISHTTLHDAVQGNRLPSWETTVEFVKACGADPGGFRERWEAANSAIRAMPPVTPPPESGADHPEPRLLEPGLLEPRLLKHGLLETGLLEPRVDRPPKTLQRTHRRWLRQIALVAALACAMTLGSLLIDVVAARENTAAGRQGVAPSPSVAPDYSAAGCPVQQPNPPAAPATDPGDRGVFVGDITLPDCTHVAHGSTVTKVWRFKNSGTFPWHGYVLHRLDSVQQRDQCQTINDVAINDTAPGQLVDVRVAVTAPSQPTFCFVRFKIEDAAGRIAFPGSRPVNFQLIVD
jgi:hypothetical protein